MVGRQKPNPDSSPNDSLERAIYMGALSPSEIKRKLSESGFVYGSTTDSERQLLDIPHTVERAPTFLSSALLELSYFCQARFPCSTLPEGELLKLNHVVAVGPLQSKFLDSIAKRGFAPIVLSGYRSPAYQSLLVAARYLDGTLLDQQGRLTSLPPEVSDHCQIDCGLDIENSEELILFMAHFSECLPFSLYRPYLFDSLVAFEPWHWRAVRAAQAAADAPHVVPRRLLSHYCQALGRFLFLKCFGSGLLQEAEVESKSTHYFIQDLNHPQQRCVGSMASTVEHALADANDALGFPNTKLITMPWGFTPALDASIAQEDIGAIVFRIHPEHALSSSYLTPYAALRGGINTPSSIIRALVAKASLHAGDIFTLEKSRADEWLVLQDAHIFPVEYGIPQIGYWRTAELISEITTRFDLWLHRNGRAEVLPQMAKGGHAAVSGYSVVHLSMLFMYLQRFHSNNAEFVLLRENLLEALYPAVMYTNISAEAQKDYMRAMVFIVRGCFACNEYRKVGERIFGDNEAALLLAVREAITNDSDPIFVGHVASLIRLMLPTWRTRLTYWADVLPKAEDCIRWIESSKLFYLAAAQVISYICCLNESPGPFGIRKKLLSIILAHPSASGPGECGSFQGLECFHSALPIEALEELLIHANDDQELVLAAERGGDAIQFLSRLQVGDGLGLLNGSHLQSSGLISYSLIDKHVRLDYGIHVCTAARFVASLARRGSGL